MHRISLHCFLALVCSLFLFATGGAQAQNTTLPTLDGSSTNSTLTGRLPTSSTAGNGAPTQSAFKLAQCKALADGKLPTWAGADFQFSGTVRTYYVAAEQVTWNYAPSGWDNWLGVPIEQSARAYEIGYLRSAGSIGGGSGLTWQKAKYVGYTDASFTKPTKEPAWIGLNGPILRAEIGDMVQIIFQNNLKSNPMNMHSMGFGYDKYNEGSLYPDALPPGPQMTSPGDAVPPGACFTYKWLVGSTNAPASGFDSRLWSYHPFVNMPTDLVTGLVGPFIVYNPGTMSRTMASRREFVLLYEGFPEYESWLDTTNVALYASAEAQAQIDANATSAAAGIPRPLNAANASIFAPQLANTPRAFLTETQGPTFQTLNGHVLGNTPPFQLCEGDEAIWYVYAFGAQSHTFHLHGNNFHVAGQGQGFYRASQPFNNGEMMTLEMTGARQGTWQVICHVSGHMAYGMLDYYQIFAPGSCPLEPLMPVYGEEKH